MFNKLKQIKELRDQAKQLKSSLAEETVQGEALGGKILVVMDGNQEIKKLTIDSSLFAPEHKQEVEEGVQEAIGKAIREVQKIMARKIRQGEISMPNLS